MTDKVKLEKLKKLADAMYYAAFNLTTDASLLRKAMKEYRQFIIHEYCKKEPVSIWHDAIRKSDNPENVVIINPSDNTGEVLTKCTGVNQGHIWAYTSELLNLDNSCNIGKNLQEPQVKESTKTQHVNETCKENGNSLTQQPKFKIGDTIIHIDDGADVIYKEHKVINVAKLGYVLDNGRTIELSDQDQWELVERKPLFKHGDILYKISDGSKIEIIDIVADQYKFECGDEFPHYEFFGYIENNYSKELVNRDLNKEIQHWREHYIKVKECGFQIDLRDIEAVARHFANWQKEEPASEDISL